MAQVSLFLSQPWPPRPAQVTLCWHATQPPANLPALPQVHPSEASVQAGNTHVHCSVNMSTSKAVTPTWDMQGEGRKGLVLLNFIHSDPNRVRYKNLHCTALWGTIHVQIFFNSKICLRRFGNGKSLQIQECPLAARVIIFFYYWFPFELRHSCHSPVPKLVVANWFSTLLHNWATGLIGTIRATCYKLLLSFVIR